MTEHSHENLPSGGGGYGRWVFWGFLLIAGFFLVTEHRAHLYGWFSTYGIWLLLLACPLLHLFHGHGHGRHGGHGKHNQEGAKDKTS